MKKILIILSSAVLFFLPFSCTKIQDSEALSPTKLSSKNSDVLSNIINQMTISQRRNSFKTAAELESRALSLATNNLASDIDQYNKFKSDTGFKDLLNTINTQNASQRQAFDKPPLSLLETCSIVSSKLMSEKDISVKINQYVTKFSKTIGNVGDKYLKQLEKEIVVVDNEKYIPNEKFKQGEYIGQILDEVDKMQKNVDYDSELNDKERKVLGAYIQTVQTNIVNIDRFFSEMFKLSVSNGRIASFWSAIAAVFSNVISAVITVVVAAVGAVVGFIISGANPYAAAAGFAIGAVIGYGLSCDWVLFAAGASSCDDCANFLYRGCSECRATYPWYTGFTCN